ncbi:hypothetical protein [Leucobacter luti]|uniref:IacB protein n=1 Tax=Leucobacter luti TaxID=340320 RepID=A0A4Q7U5W4_9MICO|nr:hypothetical protein [Leucobacter luti]MBL3701006.1 hypothetical protein [Leucobacter luti]RZT68773.1 hypothetical protein EV139_0501 [Leucobacter luti]
MTAAAPLRVLFCIGINQNFFDLPAGDGGAVWQATLDLLEKTSRHPGITYIADFDDDAQQVGPSYGWPWTAYMLADVDSQATVTEITNLLRTIRVGEHALWRYAKIEARIGRPLTVRDDVTLPTGSVHG